MSLKFDMEHGVAAGSDNFHCQLIRLMMKADTFNLYRLAEAFPATSTVYQAYLTGQPIPDLPYEGRE